MNKLMVLAGRLLLAGILLSLSRHAWSQQKELFTDSKHHAVEVFPITPFVGIYSAQYLYGFSPKDHLILGVAYVNVKTRNGEGEEVGRFHSPTLPIGYRRFFWKNLHAEYQLWPAYSMFYENKEGRYYRGFDLYNEFRAGYLFNFKLGRIPLFLNLQYVYGFGLYPGNKPASFLEATKDQPHFHTPSVLMGIRF